MPGSPPLKGGAWEKEKAGKGGIWREGEAALPRRDTILLVPVMRVSGGGLGVAREFPRLPLLRSMAAPLSLIYLSTGWRVGKGRGKAREEKNLELTALPVASGGQIVTGQASRVWGSETPARRRREWHRP